MTPAIGFNRVLALGFLTALMFGAAPPVPQAAAALLPELLGEREPARIETELAFRAALEDEDYRAARLHGGELLPLLEREFGLHSFELVEPLTALARAERESGDPDEAERTLRRALELAEQHQGRYSAALLEPKVELGLTYQALQEHPLAVATFTEAQALSRRIEGLLNARQLTAIDHSVHSLVTMGEKGRAEERAQEAFQISERALGAESPELVPALVRYGRWMHQIERFDREREAYTRIIEIIEQEGGDNDPRLIAPLRGIAASLRAERSYRDHELYGDRAPIDSTGHLRAERSLRRALDVARAQPDLTPELEASLLMDLGDWQMTLGRRQSANSEYSRVWAMLEDSHPELLEEWFGEATVLRLPEPQRRGNRSLTPPPALSSDALIVSSYGHPERGMREGRVLLRYQVDERGEIRDSRIIESEPQRRMDAAVLDSMRRARFRPRFEDGRPVVSEYQYYEFRYSYQP